LGSFHPRSLMLGLSHGFRLAILIARHLDAAVYVPISQSRWGFLRDAVLLCVARLARRARIVHLHGGYFATFHADADALLRGAIKASLTGVDQAWVLTEGLRSMFDGLVPAGRVFVLENAVDDPGAVAESADERRDGPLRLLYLANLLAEKGCFELLAALERLAETDGVPELRVRLVGDATDQVRHRIDQRRSKLAGTGIAIEVPGPLVGAAKLAEYRSADMFVYPTRYRYEGQPLVLLEAMASGLPIITTTLGGIPETIEHERSGLLVPPGDAARLGEALGRLIFEPPMRAPLGTAARQRYVERHTPSRFADRVVALLNGTADVAATGSGGR
jgi:glycosyltransferase involved in cell wall biosynthesis